VSSLRAETCSLTREDDADSIRADADVISTFTLVVLTSDGGGAGGVERRRKSVMASATTLRPAPAPTMTTRVLLSLDEVLPV